MVVADGTLYDMRTRNRAVVGYVKTHQTYGHSRATDHDAVIDEIVCITADYRPHLILHTGMSGTLRDRTRLTPSAA